MGEVTVNPNLEVDLNESPRNADLRIWIQDKELSLSTPKTLKLYESIFASWEDHSKSGIAIESDVKNGQDVDPKLFEERVVVPIQKTWGKHVKSESNGVTMKEKLEHWEEGFVDDVDCQLPLIMTMIWARKNHLRHEIGMSPNSPHPFLFVELNKDKSMQIDYAGSSLVKEVDNIWTNSRSNERRKNSWMYTEGPVTAMRFFDYLYLANQIVVDEKEIGSIRKFNLLQALRIEFFADFKPSDKEWMEGYWDNQLRLFEDREPVVRNEFTQTN